MKDEFLITGEGSLGTLLLAHGAGAGMDSPFMDAFAHGLAARGLKVVRFEFPYMAKRREDGKKRPPDRAPKLLEHFQSVIDQVGGEDPLFIGGKSMGGRMASLIAAEKPAGVAGLICLGYPFHAPGKPEKVRTEHFPDIAMPALIVQGERDPFGGAALLDSLSLPGNIRVARMPDGDHDLKPRKKSGFTTEENWQKAMDAVAGFAGGVSA
ncbi:alpha/beta fold hydrolase [Kordiimonas marina]|uniref:alpha/beta fold hydrolase n=1 Tax=Kordiimonas marina TaxID=2872312 RepID=UPI001FF62E13|nr:alpha/beta fold hydrolase [Kordiimonas marina]MCJ9429814.1 alpha/beta fold hydrolase [Kordiimonas marina]